LILKSIGSGNDEVVEATPEKPTKKPTIAPPKFDLSDDDAMDVANDAPIETQEEYGLCYI
jgi:hypothetical protein